MRKSSDPVGVTVGEADVAFIAALVGEPSRARVLMALADGRALSASALATEAGVSRQTASAHLAKLVRGALITAEAAGRQRYYRLAGPTWRTWLKPWPGSPLPNQYDHYAKAARRELFGRVALVTITSQAGLVWLSRMR